LEVEAEETETEVIQFFQVLPQQAVVLVVTAVVLVEEKIQQALAELPIKEQTVEMVTQVAVVVLEQQVQMELTQMAVMAETV
jgi:hypothetical protein